MADITQIISTFPPAPDSSTDTPTEFNSKSDAFVNHQSAVYVGEVNQWTTEANGLKGDMNQLKADIDNIVASIPDGSIDDVNISPTNVFSNQKTEAIYAKKESVIGQNILINPNLSINQRGVTTLPASGQYWYDRWRSTGTGMVQVIEAGGYVQNAVYTYSGIGITTHQITAPTSGDWVTTEVPSTARQLKLELGTVATPFEHRPMAEEVGLCQRYYEKSETFHKHDDAYPTGVALSWWISFNVVKRIIPIMEKVTEYPTLMIPSSIALAKPGGYSLQSGVTDSSIVVKDIYAVWEADAEIY